MTADFDDCDYQPRSLWECHQLLSKPLGRDHILVKEVEKRNLISVGDVIRGVGTECMKESRLRSSLALSSIRTFVSEISSRNAAVLGGGLIRTLLALETNTDDDGVPLDEEENIVTDIVADLIMEIQLKAGPEAIQDISDHVLRSREVLLYTKYKLLRSFRKAIVGLDSRLEKEKTARLAIIDHPPHSSHSLAIAAVPTQRSLVSIHSSFSEFLAFSLDKHMKNITDAEKFNPFTDQIFLTELISTKLELFKKSKNDLSIIESSIPILTKFVIDHSQLDENFLRAYLQFLVVDPQVLTEIVTDSETLFLVRKAISKLSSFPSLPIEVKEIVSLIHDCINPTRSPEISL